MSFASDVKSELAHLEITSDCCALAELAAIAQICGDISILGAGRYGLCVTMDSAETARRVYQLAKRLYGLKPEIYKTERRRLYKGSNYEIAFTEQTETSRLLSDIGLVKSEAGALILGGGIDQGLLRHNCCSSAYLRGAFLAAGTLSNPNRGYHLEFVIKSEALSAELTALLNSHELNARCGRRKDICLVYIKESDRIAELLTIMGAHTSVLELESVRVYKDVRNNVNRRVNCETANIDRTTEAAGRQIEAVRYLKDNMGINKLPEQLRIIAEARLNHEDASLNQLAELLAGTVGRSGINYRLNKLVRLADSIRISKGEM